MASSSTAEEAVAVRSGANRFQRIPGGLESILATRNLAAALASPSLVAVCTVEDRLLVAVPLAEADTLVVQSLTKREEVGSRKSWGTLRSDMGTYFSCDTRKLKLNLRMQAGELDADVGLLCGSVTVIHEQNASTRLGRRRRPRVRRRGRRRGGLAEIGLGRARSEASGRASERASSHRQRALRGAGKQRQGECLEAHRRGREDHVPEVELLQGRVPLAPQEE